MSMLQAVGAKWMVAQPDPGKGKPPPGADKLTQIVQWAAWIALALCVLGVILVGVMMALSHRRGTGGEHGASLGWVLAGCIVIGSASAIVGALV